MKDLWEDMADYCRRCTIVRDDESVQLIIVSEVSLTVLSCARAPWCAAINVLESPWLEDLMASRAPAEPGPDESLVALGSEPSMRVHEVAFDGAVSFGAALHALLGAVGAKPYLPADAMQGLRAAALAGSTPARWFEMRTRLVEFASSRRGQG